MKTYLIITVIIAVLLVSVLILAGPYLSGTGSSEEPALHNCIYDGCPAGASEGAGTENVSGSIQNETGSMEYPLMGPTNPYAR